MTFETKEVAAKKGEFKRKKSQFRHWITQDGSPGPNQSEGGFTPDKDRYHLFGSLACPWVNRTLIMRNLKGLETFIPVTIVHWHMGKEGWHFTEDKLHGSERDPLYNFQFIAEFYEKAQPGYVESGGVRSVPLLWDKKRETIVNNESSEIIRMFNQAFDKVGAKEGDYYPQALRSEIDAFNERIYPTVNNGVYRTGFAKTQEAYNEAYYALFATLDFLEAHLKGKHFLVGDRLTEADIRLFPTLARFDAVYFGHFKCNKKRLVEYPELWRYTRELYANPAFGETINLFHIKHHYYGSHPNINPTGIIPLGPDIDFSL